MMLIILIFIILVVFIYKIADMCDKKYQENKKEKESYKKQFESERAAKLYYWSMYYELKNNNRYSSDVIEAVRYAVIKSHPDNGGKAEDFIKFNKCLKKLESEKNVNQN